MLEAQPLPDRRTSISATTPTLAAKRITAVVRHRRSSAGKMAKAGPKLGGDAPTELGRMGELSHRDTLAGVLWRSGALP